jgi:Holliday junction resolvasome RuvABC endonuclease subunit
MVPDLVLGLDLTTLMGWALFDLDGELEASGAWDLSMPAESHEGDRWIAFRGELGKLLLTYRGRICAIGYERPSTVQWATARVAFGQAALVELEAARASIPTTVVSPSTLKMVVAGHGHASKDEVQAAVVLRTGPLTHPGLTKKAAKLRGDEADARAIAIVLVTIYCLDALRRCKLVRRPVERRKAHRKKAPA